MKINRKLAGAAAMTVALGTGGVVGALINTPSISGAQDTTTTAPADPGQHTDPDQRGGKGGRGFAYGLDLETAADALGLSIEDLRTQLGEGKTLAEIATAQGVDRQALIDALVAAGQARLDEQKAALPERIGDLLDRKLPGGRGGPGGFGERGPGGFGGGGAALRPDAAAEVLGLSAEDLFAQLREGKTLAEIATAQGVEPQAVIDALLAPTKERLAARVADGDLTQAEADERLAELTERIGTFVDEGFGAGGFGHGPGGGHRGGRPGGERPDGERPEQGGPAPDESTTTTEN